MTNQELADHLNEQAALSGRDVVTVNVIRQWVDWSLLSNAKIAGKAAPKGGPEWSRGEADMRRAYRLAELRKRGVRRQTALVVHAYLEWGYSDYSYLRKCLQSEWEKWRNQLVRRHITSMDGRDYAEISSVQKRALKNQLGDLYPGFVGTVAEQSPEAYAVIAELSKFGEYNFYNVEFIISESIARMLPDLSLEKDVITAFANSFAGLTGDAEEITNSANSAISHATERQLRLARHYTRVMQRAPQKLKVMRNISDISYFLRNWPQFENSLYQQMSIGPWLTGQFVQTLLLVMRSSGMNCAIGNRPYSPIKSEN